jgi:hypothetical protein
MLRYLAAGEPKGWQYDDHEDEIPEGFLHNCMVLTRPARQTKFFVVYFYGGLESVGPSFAADFANFVLKILPVSSTNDALMYFIKKVGPVSEAVFQTRIRIQILIRMFLGFLDPHPDT